MQLVLGGFGMYLFLRQIDLSVLPSLFGGLAFSLSPYYYGLINAGHAAKLYAICYIPWILLAHRYAVISVTWKSVLFLGLVGALQLWTKHVQIVYYTWMVIVFLLIWDQGRAVIKREWISNAEKCKNYIRLVETYSIQSNLKKGYSIISKDKKIINKTKHIRENDILSARLMDKTIEIKVKKIN